MPSRPDAFRGQRYRLLQRACLCRRSLFEDPEFPAGRSSLFYRRAPPEGLSWKRPGVKRSRARPPPRTGEGRRAARGGGGLPGRTREAGRGSPGRARPALPDFRHGCCAPSPSRDSPPSLLPSPQELCSDPRLFVDGISPGDLHQGSLGNCWFVAAASCLAGEPAAWKRVGAPPVPGQALFPSGGWKGPPPAQAKGPSPASRRGKRAGAGLIPAPPSRSR